VDSIDTFSRVRDVHQPRSKKELEALRNTPEMDVKQAFAEIISEPDMPPDWGGEQSDLFSSQVMLDATIPHLIRERGRSGRWGGRISDAAAGRGGSEASKLALWL
jgi:hypothetical protein